MSSNHDSDYKFQYKALKRKLKVLIYENEFFQEELHKAHRSLLRVQRDKSFLLDRILLYQQGPDSSTDSDETEESDNESSNKEAINKRKKTNSDTSSSFHLNLSSGSKGTSAKKKKAVTHNNTPVVVTKSETQLYRNTGKLSSTASPNSASSKSSASPKTKVNHMNLGASMSREEIERQLAARQPITDFPTTVSLTLPNQLFSDNLLEGDFIDNDIDTSPSNLEDDVTVDNFD